MANPLKSHMNIIKSCFFDQLFLRSKKQKRSFPFQEEPGFFAPVFQAPQDGTGGTNVETAWLSPNAHEIAITLW